jgi:hypothetical protein
VQWGTFREKRNARRAVEAAAEAVAASVEGVSEALRSAVIDALHEFADQPFDEDDIREP